MTRSLLLVCSLFLSQASFAETISITQKQSGKTIEATPISLKGDTATFELKKKSYSLPLDSLTQESQDTFKSWAEALKNKDKDLVEKLMKSIGHPLFEQGKKLWDEPAENVAGRLSWRKESDSGSISFRSYPAADYGFLNAHPYCCTLYADDQQKVSHLSLVFANKGDYGSSTGSGEDHFQPQSDLPEPKSLNEAIQRDTKSISAALTVALGEPTQQRYGEKEDRRKALRWDFDGQSFILSERKSEYVHLVIVPSSVADKQGKFGFIKDQDLRDTLLKNVVTEDNGDTYISNIPMVDQGPKGYCVPATFERAMRYMHVPADMYLLATIATAQGGGTVPSLLADEAKRIIRSKARRIKDLDLKNDLDMRLVKKYTNKGVPILWSMCSLKKYNKIANSRSKERKSIEDFSDWTTTLQQEADTVVPSLSATSNYHTCMIIGYNEKTKEIAVSDSWGSSYAIRWIHIDIAKAVTIPGGFIIDL